MEPRTRIQSGPDLLFPSAHPAAVSDDRVDLTVVRQKTKRLRQRPCWLRVGGEALVEDRKAALKVMVVQFRIKNRQLPRRQQAFVDDGTRGKRTEINAATQFGLNPFAEQEQPQLKVAALAGLGKKALPDC